MNANELKKLIRETVIEMVFDGGLQIDSYIKIGNGYRNNKSEIVTLIGTNEGDTDYKIISESREEIDLDELTDLIKGVK